MEINNLTQNIDLDKNLENEKEQKSFLETTLGKTINGAVDIGIRALLPDFIDEQVINIKDNLLEYPHYTRPREFMNLEVPSVLLSGNHKNIDKWRYEESIKITKERRPDLYKKACK